MYRDSCLPYRCILRHVFGWILNQCAFHACHRIVCGISGRWCYRNDREYLYPYRKRNDSERGGYRRGQRNLFCRYFNDYHADRRILPHRLYGWYDGTFVPGVQYRNLRVGYHLFICRIDFHANVGNQVAYKAGETRLVLYKDRTFLWRNEPAIQPFTCRFPE